MADALGLGPSEVTLVRVRVSPAAPLTNIVFMFIITFMLKLTANQLHAHIEPEAIG